MTRVLTLVFGILVAAEEHETECDSSYCSNHGSATWDVTNGCDCFCESGWRGSRCEEEFSCDASYCNDHGDAHVSSAVSPTLTKNGNVKRIYGCACMCNVGWQGLHCEMAACAPTDCSNHGTATLSGSYGCDCTCEAGWGGSHCEEVQSNPQTSSPKQHEAECDSFYCSNHGSATGSTTDGCDCACESGWRGSQCEEEFSCHASYCNNHGDAHVSSAVSPTLTKNGNVQRIYGCACMCNVGWQGLHCEKAACASTDCSNHGTATLSDSYGCDCTCEAGWGGSHCEEAQSNPQTSPPKQHETECDSSYCSNHGSATWDVTNGCDCSCESGWRGSQCEESFSCDASFCSNHGYAHVSSSVSPTLTKNGNVQRTYGCACMCNVGWQGLQCEKPACASTDCSNHGTATLSDSYGCDCTCEAGWGGSRCEEAQSNPQSNQQTSPPEQHETECDSLYCSNHGSATWDVTNGCDCSCENGWRGSQCEEEFSCDASYCNNHGDAHVSSAVSPTLTKNGNVQRIYSCACMCNVGWQGLQCEKAACASTDCSNHGTATLSDSYGCDCTCEAGWGGSHCEEAQSNPRMPPPKQHAAECDSSACSYHGVATAASAYGCECTCDFGWQGSRCEEGTCAALYCHHGIATGNARDGCECTCETGWHGFNCAEQDDSSSGTVSLFTMMQFLLVVAAGGFGIVQMRFATRSPVPQADPEDPPHSAHAEDPLLME